VQLVRLEKRLVGQVTVALVLSLCIGSAIAQELRLAPDRALTFVDADGRAVRSTDFRGKWLLVYFGYTHCTDLCPTGLSILANALDQIGPAADHVQPLFVTVDPERDKGPLLRTFAQAFDKRLIGLGGSVTQIKEAAAALGVSFEKVAQGGSGYVVDHTSTYVLIDPSRARAQSMRIAEPHLLAAKLVEALTKAGVPLDNVKNVGAYR
jgi:cytochrome oxidase Cu insertion factor (SCO1/SenC/PrrC family)